MSKWSFYILMGILIASPSACVSSERRVADVVQTIRHPDGVTLVYGLIGHGQGSQDACFSTYFYGLYGTEKENYEDIATFYEDHLVEDGWQRVYYDWLPNGGPFFERQPGFNLSIGSDVQVSGIPRDTIERAQAEHDLLYLMVISYHDWLARTRCLTN